MSAQIDQQDAYIHKFLTMIPVNAAVQGLFNALVVKDSIEIHANVSAQSLDPHAQMIRNSMTLHASVSARIDLRGAPTLRYLTMIDADVDVPVYSDALVDRNLIQIHVNVSALDQCLHAPMIRNLMM